MNRRSHRPRDSRLAAALAAGLCLAAGPAAAQYSPNLPSVVRQPAVKPCCEGYDARGSARDFSLQQQQRLRTLPPPAPAPGKQGALGQERSLRTPELRTPDLRTSDPLRTRPGMALEGGGEEPGAVYDGASRELFRPVKPPAPLN